LVVAGHAGLPSVLVENFTWDWIYDHYQPLVRHAAGFAELFSMADFHIQSEPVCFPSPEAHCVPPISRSPRRTAAEVRAQLGVLDQVPLVLVTMGGIEWRYSCLDGLSTHTSAFFVVPGVGSDEVRKGSLVTLPHRSTFYHPDLMTAADVVIGKLGYSTLAESYAARAAFGFVPRPGFPESGPLGLFARERMGAVEISPDEFRDGSWLRRIDTLLGSRRSLDSRPNGAEEAARKILELAHY
jgi:hypothetical protein